MPGEQRRQNCEAVLRGLFERAVLAREFRSGLAILAPRVRAIARGKFSTDVIRRIGYAMQFTGTAIKYGRDVDTDAIIAARYLNSSDMSELAAHCMEDLDPTFTQRVKPGDIIIAGENFGCGSSREHAPSCIKAAGISCVIAKSFARIFYRNAINVGLPIIESPEAADGIEEDDAVFADTGTGIIEDLTTGESWNVRPFEPFIQEIIEAGGLVARTKMHR